MGFSCSYAEVQRLEKNAASFVAPNILGEGLDYQSTMTLFAAYNVDHTIITIDVYWNIPWNGNDSYADTIPRKRISDIQVKENTQMNITEYLLLVG